MWQLGGAGDRRGVRRRAAAASTFLAVLVVAIVVAVVTFSAGPAPSAGGASPAGAPADGAALGGSESAPPSIEPAAASSPSASARSASSPATTTVAPRTPSPAPSPTPRVSTAPSPAVAPSPSPRATRPPTPRPTAPPTAAAPCPVFPASNVWNADVSRLPVAANSARMIAAIGLTRGLHPDFGSYAGYGIPYNIVGPSTPRVAVSFDYAGESDPGPYPIPASPRIEGGSDRHMLLVDTTGCRLYELYDAQRTASGWTAGSGAIWNLRSNALRPAGWTSADAAGLPIFPGLVRYDEVSRGAIRHALRFTAPKTCAGYIYPARHQAGSGSCATNPPMGLRVRLKASVDISHFGPQSRAVLSALKRYGMILADNGSPWYVTGAPDSRWNDDELHALGGITGDDFEVVDTSGLVNG